MLKFIKPQQKIHATWFLGVALWLLIEPFNNALMGWVDEKAGITNLVVQQLLIYSWQFGLPAVLAAFGILYYFQLQVNQQTSGSLISEESKYESDTSTATASTPFPDWTIRELFFYLRPDLVDDHTAVLWERVGSEVKDQLSIGRLQIWGREILRPNRIRTSLQEIEKSYWVQAVFSYWFLAENHEEVNHTFTNKGVNLTEYCDLRVNKAQALKIWPKPLVDEFMSLTEAATVVYEEARQAGSVWAYAAERLGAKGLKGESLSSEVLNYMAQYIAGEVQIYGCRPPSRLTEEIAVGKAVGTFENNASEFRFSLGKSPTYTELKINRADIDRLIECVRTNLKADDPI